MSIEETPPFKKAIIWSALIIGGMIAAVIVHFILWLVADGLGLGWDHSDFVRDRVLMIGWGIVFPAIIVAVAIIGLKIYEETEYITLIFGIAIAAMGTVLIILTALQISANVGQLIDKLGDGVEGFYIFFIIISAVGVGFSVMVALAGKGVIKYYYDEQT